MVTLGLRFDEIGYWSEIKLEIVKEYASAYSTILAAQTSPSFSHVYIDAFAGAGIHISKQSREFIPGSPINALLVQPPFDDYYLIDLDSARVENLRSLIGSRRNVHLFDGDCNEILLASVFPSILFENYRRGLCVLDPYGLHLNWKSIATAGRMKSIDLFLNFPVQDINRNVLWRNPEKVNANQISRMNAFWGDESWRNIAYDSGGNLFNIPIKESNETLAEAFRERLRSVAGFARVPEPMPMRNSTGAIVYYLYFASQKGTAEDIVLDIFRKYQNRV